MKAVERQGPGAQAHPQSGGACKLPGRNGTPLAPNGNQPLTVIVRGTQHRETYLDALLEAADGDPGTIAQAKSIVRCHCSCRRLPSSHSFLTGRFAPCRVRKREREPVLVWCAV